MTIEVPDVEICADISSDKGYCAHTISNSEREVTGQEWSEFNKKALKLSPESYGKIKATLLKLCKKQKDCNFDQAQEMFNRLERELN